MGSLADLQREIDAEIFEEIGEVMISGSIETRGVFFNRPRSVGNSEGEFVGLELSFDCQLSDHVGELVRGDLVQIVARDDAGLERDLGTYAFQRRVPDAGDESGLVHIELALP